MRYHEAAGFLFDLRRFQVHPGTDAIRALLDHLGDPQEGVTFVQVAGSNGKGSTARMVESILREDGHRVGLYTSPHFDDVRERVRVDGRKLPESALCAFVEAAKPFLVERAATGDPLTFFETVTAMGIWYFGEASVDVAVLEVGIGGKYDATSVVDPVASAVTNVTLEHTAVLGETVEEIATRKAHVAPANAPLVTGATGDALAAIEAHAGDVVTVGTPDESPDISVAYGGRVNHAEADITVDAPEWHVDGRLPLLGEHQARNAGVAAVLARQVADVSESTVARGLRSAHWPGRFEVCCPDPLVVLDGAHNPGACAAVADILDEFDYDRLHIVFGAMHDKDHRAMIAALPTPDTVETCAPNLERAEDPEVLASVFESSGVKSVHASRSVAGALARARSRSDPGDCLLVVGSLFAVAEARTTWTRVEIPRRVDDVEMAETLLARAHVTDRAVAETSDKAVHRVVETRVERRQARLLREELLELGGECAVSGLENAGELVEVVMMGTEAQFRRLRDRLHDRPFGLPAIASELDGTLDWADSRPRCGYPWEDSPSVMGILNVTPDSFHDGGEYLDHDVAIERANAMVDAGADIVDVGGESTRPGADPIPVEAELDRVLPVVEAIAESDALVSIDTRKAEVGAAALDAGADVLNDVTGLADPEMRFVAAEYDVPIVVMHSIDAPVVPEKQVVYDDVVSDVIDELRERVLLAEKAGVPREHVIVDPGLGFGKTAVENFELLGRLDEFRALGCPILVGHSHKSMFELVGQPAGDTLEATIAASALAVDRGADILRVHDVDETVAAVRTVLATRDPSRFDR